MITIIQILEVSCFTDDERRMVDTKKLIFNDIDGEANGGTFKSDSVCMKDMESKQIKKGDGNWYLGTYEYNMEIKTF